MARQARPQRKMTMGRDYTLRTTKGHTLRFEAGVPRAVPKSVEDEAMRFGAIPENQEALLREQREQEEAARQAASEPDAPRDELLYEAVVEMRAENKADEFDARGRPKVAALARRTGLKEVTSEERDEMHDRVVAEERQGA